MGNTNPKDMTDYTEEDGKNASSHHSTRLADADTEVICDFTYSQPAERVELYGSFLDNWKKGEPMQKRDGVFYFQKKLGFGRHFYKFMVDGNWKYNQDQPCVTNSEGIINNVIDIVDKSGVTTPAVEPEENGATDANNEIVDQINDVDDILDSIESEEPPKAPEISRFSGYFQKENLKTNFIKNCFENKQFESFQDVELLAAYNLKINKPCSVNMDRLVQRDHEKMVVFAYSFSHEKKISNVKFYLSNEVVNF